MPGRTVHWHTEASEGHLVCRFIDACLQALFARPDAEVTVVHSWGDPEHLIGVRQYPFGRNSTSASWQALTTELQPDDQVVVRPDGEYGATLSVSHAGTYPREAHAGWAWAGLPLEHPRSLSDERCLPTLRASRSCIERLAPGRVILLLAPTALADLTEGLEFAARLQQALPELQVRPQWDQTAWDRLLRTSSGGSSPFQVPQCEWDESATLIFAGHAMAWAPLVLQALAEGRRVLLPEGAAYHPLVHAVSPGIWSGSLGAAGQDQVVARLEEALRDPAGMGDQCRRASAWARRWGPAREGAKLLQLVQGIRDPVTAPSQPARELTVKANPPSGRTRWVVRREVGIGDILFSLSVAATLRDRDPDAHIRFHTAGPHAEWVSWFPHVDEVTHGPFAPRWGERIADFEAVFPGLPDCDRTLALGAEIGITPDRWTAAPELPVESLTGASARLGPAAGLRIAFAGASRTHARMRTLLPARAAELAAALTQFGEVVWLDAEAPLTAPPAEVLDLRGRLSVAEAWAVLAQCDIVVSVDSGLLYAGVTLGKPVVGLFSHIAALERLWLAPHFLAVQPHLPCSPCGEGLGSMHCLDRHTPGGASLFMPPCLDLVGVNVVEAAVAEVLRQETAGVRRKLVWSVAPGGSRTEWDVDALPVPWRPPIPGREGTGAALLPGLPR